MPNLPSNGSKKSATTLTLRSGCGHLMLLAALRVGRPKSATVTRFKVNGLQNNIAKFHEILNNEASLLSNLSESPDSFPEAFNKVLLNAKIECCSSYKTHDGLLNRPTYAWWNGNLQELVLKRRKCLSKMNKLRRGASAKSKRTKQRVEKLSRYWNSLGRELKKENASQQRSLLSRILQL